jgi:hypothetical protein
LALEPILRSFPCGLIAGENFPIASRRSVVTSNASGAKTPAGDENEGTQIAYQSEFVLDFNVARHVRASVGTVPRQTRRQLEQSGQRDD